MGGNLNGDRPYIAIRGGNVKRYIKSSSNTIEIYIDVIVAQDIAIAASEQYPEDELIGHLRADFDDFVTNAYGVMTHCGFDILDFDTSSRVNSKSSYFTIAKFSEIQNKDIKCVVFIRLSDHTLNPASDKLRKKYYDDKAQEYKQPQTKSHQKWKLISVIVDGVQYQDFDDALDGLEKRLNKI